MEDSQVLNADSKAAPMQAPEAIDDNAFLQAIQPTNSAPNQNIYGSNQPVVAEKDHASNTAFNITRDNYNYNSGVDQSKNPTVKTQGVVNGKVTPEVEWTSKQEMDNQFKATSDSDYSWNKIAEERSQYTYDQEATQVLSDYTKSMQEIKEAGAQAMDTYFSAAYIANQTADKMGWQGSQVQSQEAKTAFLKASVAADMYSKYELQKYGVDSQLSVARMYAEANMEALALELYQDEIATQQKQAELTGYYISPEANEIMKQQETANKILGDKNSTQKEKDRANKVINAGNNYFDKLGFSKDENGKYVGVELLSRLEFQETQRANRRNEELQQQANNIADQARKDNNANAGAQLRLQEEQLKVTKNQTYAIQQQTKFQQAMTTFTPLLDKEGTTYPGFIKSDNNYVGIEDPVVRTEKGKTYCYGTINGKAHKMEYNSSKAEWQIIK